MKSVTVIIPHHKGTEMIEKCLNSLSKVEADKIVITSDLNFNTKHVGVSVIKTLINSPTHKRNFAVSRSRSKYLCFMDDDVTVMGDCINDMVHYLDTNPKVGMVYAYLFTEDGKVDTSGSYLTTIGFLNETYERRLGGIKILSGKSACCMIRRDLFDKLGGFDESYVIYGEETDLSWRLWLLGYEVHIYPSASAYHLTKPRDCYRPNFIHYHGCKNYLMTLYKNLETKNLWRVAVNMSIWNTVALMFLFKNRQVSKWIWQGIGSFLIDNDKKFKRRHVQSSRVINDKELFKDIFRNPPLSYYWNRLTEYINHQFHAKHR